MMTIVMGAKWRRLVVMERQAKLINPHMQSMLDESRLLGNLLHCSRVNGCGTNRRLPSSAATQAVDSNGVK